MIECCYNCKYWKGYTKAYAMCMRYPKWIETYRDHGCGEFKAKAGGQHEID